MLVRYWLRKQLGFLMLTSLAFLLAYAICVGGNLCVQSDDDLTDSSRLFLSEFADVPADPYMLPALRCTGVFSRHRREAPIAHWVAPARFARSPPPSVC